MKALPLTILTAAGIAIAAGALLKTRSVSVKGAPPSATAAEDQFNLPATLSFNEHIQPILSTNCYHCHGPDSGTRKASLRLDREASAFAPAASGEPAIRRDHPEDSALLQRILSTKASEVMPPPEAHAQLKPVEKAMLARWVREGAHYQPHWAFIAPVKPAVPEDKADRWSRTPIDHFIAARLRREGLPPSGPEDPRTLIRRVSLDLTGLLPEPADVDAFAKKTTDEAYAAYVEKLLASPRFGEHRARYWLDYARYGDTNGLHFDNVRSIWPYRDYVIGAFNANKPFNDFVREQLAGDLLPRGGLEALIATGYLRCNVTTNEGGTITEEVAINNARDRAEAFGITFLGLSVGCAACHDHKFDPTSQRDFYSLTAFLNNTAEKAWDENSSESPPILRVPNEQNRPAAEALLVQGAEVAAQIAERRRQAAEIFRASFSKGLKPVPVNPDALELRLRVDEGKGDTVHNSAPGAKIAEFHADTNPLVWGEDTWLWPSARMDLSTKLFLGPLGDVEANEKFSAGAWLMLRLKPSNTDTGNGSLFGRMGGADRNANRGWDIYQDGGRFVVHLVNNWPAKVVKVQTKATFPRGEWHHVFFSYDGSSKAAGIRLFVDGQPVETDTLNDTLDPGLTIRTDARLSLGRRDDVDPMRETRFQDVRFYRRALDPAEVARLPFEDVSAEIVARSTDPAKWTEDERFIVLNHWLLDSKDATFAQLRAQQRDLGARLEALTKDGAVTLVAREKTTPAHANVLTRGVYTARAGRVDPAVPAFLPPLPKDHPADRLALANWLVAPENPLTIRVTINRMWNEVFGRGLVETTEDFGVMGARPSHPELLDWLAVDFREHGWDVKRFYRQLVLSSAYRQSSHSTPAQLEKDPANRLLSHSPRFRMDGEMIRDTALQSAGLLANRLGGPPVKPYQPEGIWEAISMPESDTKKYVPDHGEGLYRRSLYAFWKRFAPPPSLETFDSPARDTACTRRARTDTPLQALVTMNDPQFVEASRKLAERALRQSADPSGRLDFLSRETLARSLDATEKTSLLASGEKFRAHFASQPDDAKALLSVGEAPADPAMNPNELAEWTLVASSFYNLDEYLNK